MIYKGILLDIDNTLYDYHKAHDKALKALLEYCDKTLKVSKDKALEAYNKARKNINDCLSGFASSHNRILYIQKMLEMLKVNALCYSEELYAIYWDTFLDNMEVFEGVYEFLSRYKDKICFVTDLTAHIQHRKIRRLHLEKYTSFLVSSEEVGVEKPHKDMFNAGLEKLGLYKEDVCVIGDSFNRDIKGAINNGLRSIWVDRDGSNILYDKGLVIKIKEFKEVLNLT